MTYSDTKTVPMTTLPHAYFERAPIKPATTYEPWDAGLEPIRHRSRMVAIDGNVIVAGAIVTVAFSVILLFVFGKLIMLAFNQE